MNLQENAPDGADAKAEFAENLVKSGVSLEQYISRNGIRALPCT